MRQANPVDTSTLEVIHRFNLAFNRHAVDDIMALMTTDCVFENTYPPPDGERFVGQAAVRACFESFFRDSPAAAFEFGDAFACGERACVRWRYRWVEPGGLEGHVLGVDIFRVLGDKVAEKCSYVKG
jgi:ketosteroid isomerase-like protein